MTLSSLDLCSQRRQPPPLPTLPPVPLPPAPCPLPLLLRCRLPCPAEEGVAKLADVGMVRHSVSGLLTAPPVMTPLWAAPEVLRRERAGPKVRAGASCQPCQRCQLCLCVCLSCLAAAPPPPPPPPCVGIVLCFAPLP